MPKVSIITAAYNHVEFVRQSIESVRNQTYRDFEHIVIDDGSTDGTADVLESFGTQIKYFRQENRGAHAAINRGIRESSGEYIAILDSDDAWLPQKLERQMAAFDQYPGASMVYSQAYIIDGAGEIGDPTFRLGSELDQERPFEDVLMNYRVPVLTAVIKRSCLDDVGSFVENLKVLADWELWLRISARCQIAFVPEPLALYRVHPRNTYQLFLESGYVIRERLIVLKNTAAGRLGDPREIKRRRSILNVMYAFTTLRQAYALSYRGEYTKAAAFFLYAMRLRPALIKDLPAALKLDPTLLQNSKMRRVMTNILFGPRERFRQAKLTQNSPVD